MFRSPVTSACILLCALLCLLAPLQGCVGSSAYQSLLAKDYDRAAFEYAHELRQNPGNLRAAVFQGYAYYKGGHYEMAYDALMPLTEQSRVAGFASFWAGLAALKLEDRARLYEAWSRWKKQDPFDYESLSVMRESQAALMNRDLTGLAFMADEVEMLMSEAYAKDDYLRNQNSFRRTMAFSESHYDGMLKLRPLPYLP